MNFFLITLIFTLNFKAQAQISVDDFHSITQIFYDEFRPEIQKQNSMLFINNPPTPDNPDFWWNLETVRAAYSSHYDGDLRTHYLFVMGGYGKLPGMTKDAVAATLCHELGHGLAGAPFKLRNEKALVSVEGQADYYAYRFCLARIFKRLPPSKPVLPVSAFTDSLCKKTFKTSDELFFCTRAFQVLEVERMYLSYLSQNLVTTSYNKLDLSKVEFVDTSEDFYPGDQCRLDTMMAGLLQKSRPACWFF
jgi:hypothetical protein